jgi:hypothetical protein
VKKVDVGEGADSRRVATTQQPRGDKKTTKNDYGPKRKNTFLSAAMPNMQSFFFLVLAVVRAQELGLRRLTTS